MEAQACTTLSSVQCLSKLSPFLSQKQKLSFHHSSLLSRRCCCTIKQDLRLEHSTNWLCRSNSSRSSNFAADNPTLTLFEGISETTRWAALLLYRALLIGGIGLGLAAPAIACTAPSPSANVVSVKTFKKDAGKVALGDEFWKDIDLSRGSCELILKKVLDNDPTNSSALECLAKQLMDNDDFSHALLVLEKLEVLEPKEMEWKYLKAEAFDMDGQSKLAKKIFEDILRVEPFSTRALQGLVLAMDQLDESDAALKIVENTWNKAKKGNNLVEARDFGMLIGQLYTLKGRMQEALQHYKVMIEEDENDYRPYLFQGIVYSVLGETDMAEQQFQTFEKLCPQDLPGRTSLDGLMSRARKEGQRVFEFKQKQKAKKGKKGS